jgi:hypothetical protein
MHSCETLKLKTNYNEKDKKKHYNKTFEKTLSQTKDIKKLTKILQTKTLLTSNFQNSHRKSSAATSA